MTVSMYWLGLFYSTESLEIIQTEERYGCVYYECAVFTCVPVRVIHLEIVADLSYEQILLAFRHFIVRWGQRQQIILSNVPQFKLTKSAIDVARENEIREPDVQSNTAEQRIKWSFILQLFPCIEFMRDYTSRNQ